VSKRYHDMGDLFATIRNRERHARVEAHDALSVLRIVTGFAKSFRGRGPSEVDDESIAAWIEGLFDGNSRSFDSGTGQS